MSAAWCRGRGALNIDQSPYLLALCLTVSISQSACLQDDYLGGGTQFEDAVSISTALKANMDAEGAANNDCFMDILGMLTPLQQA